jgi:hypothetical protein
MAANRVKLSKADLEELNTLFDPKTVFGDRYGDMKLTFHGNK